MYQKKSQTLQTDPARIKPSPLQQVLLPYFMKVQLRLIHYFCIQWKRRMRLTIKTLQDAILTKNVVTFCMRYLSYFGMNLVWRIAFSWKLSWRNSKQDGIHHVITFLCVPVILLRHVWTLSFKNPVTSIWYSIVPQFYPTLFWQILPIVKVNDKHSILEALISSNNNVWGEFHMHLLKTNMRLATAAAARTRWVLLSQEEEEQLGYVDMLIDVSKNRHSLWCQVIQEEDENISKLGFPFMKYNTEGMVHANVGHEVMLITLSKGYVCTKFYIQ